MATQTIEQRPTARPRADSPTGRWRWALIVVVGIGGVVLSALLYRALLARDHRLAEAQFKLDAERRAEGIEDELHNRLGVVRVLAAFFAGSHTVERTEFRTFTESLLSERSGTEALAWVRCVSAAQRDAHQQTARIEGYDQYRITQRNRQGQLVPAVEREEYFPICYIEPEQHHRASLGFDLGSSPECLAALKRARSTGRLTVARAAPLGTGAGKPDALFVVAPARQEGPSGDTPRQSGENPDGFVLGVFRIGDIVDAAIKYFSPVGVDTHLFETSSRGDITLVYAHPSRLRREPPVPPTGLPREVPGATHFVNTFPLADRQWIVCCTPLKLDLETQHFWGRVSALLGGLLLTGLVVGYLVLLTGRTAQVEKLVTKQAIEVRESEQRFRHLVENAGDAFFLHDDRGRILDVNQRACDSLGYTREELLRLTVPDVDAEFFVGNHIERYWKRLSPGSPLTFEGVHRRKDGTTYPAEIRLASLEMGGQKLMIGLVRDITDRKRAEEAVNKEQQLLKKLLGLQEQDRKLVAYEIHDGLAQQLTGALLKLQSFGRPQNHEPEEAEATYEDVKQLLSESIQEVRRLISGLRPPVLDESGIVAAIDYLICEKHQPGGPEIDFRHDVRSTRLPAPLESAVFRIVQESLTNARRHSQSDKVRVELTQVGDRLRVEVEDRGIGFDPEQVEGNRFGLQGIRERARLLGGEASVQSAPGQGTRITVELPLLEATPEDSQPESP